MKQAALVAATKESNFIPYGEAKKRLAAGGDLANSLLYIALKNVETDQSAFANIKNRNSKELIEGIKSGKYQIKNESVEAIGKMMGNERGRVLLRRKLAEFKQKRRQESSQIRSGSPADSGVIPAGDYRKPKPELRPPTEEERKPKAEMSFVDGFLASEKVKTDIYESSPLGSLATKMQKTLDTWAQRIAVGVGVNPAGAALPDFAKSLVGEIAVGVPRMVPGLLQMGDPNAPIQFKLSGAADTAFGVMDAIGVGATAKTLPIFMRTLFKSSDEVATVLKAANVENADEIAEVVVKGVADASDKDIQRVFVDLESGKVQQFQDVPAEGSKNATPTKTPPDAQKPITEGSRADTDVSQGTTYRTSRGSEYTVKDGGSTVRNKAPRKEHPGDEGVKPPSQTTFYVDSDSLNKLAEFQAQGGHKKRIAQHSDGRWGVQYIDGPDAGKFETRTMVDVSDTPVKGKHPVELWDDGSTVHFGNEIVDVKKGAEQVSTVTDDAAKIADELEPGASPGGSTRTIDEIAAETIEAGRPKGGGIKGKQAGKVDAGSIAAAAESASGSFRKAFGKFHDFGERLSGGREKVLDRIGKFLADSFGGTKSKIASQGETGKIVRHQLRQIFADWDTLVGSHGEFLAQTVKGRLSHIPITKRRAIMEDMVKRVRRGDDLTAQQKPIWDAWVRSNGALVTEAQELGVFVDRYVDGNVTEKLLNEEIMFMRNGERTKATVIEIGENSIFARINDAAGSIVELGTGKAYSSRQLIDPEEFLPNVLKREFADKIKNRGSKTHRQAVNHLIETGQAADEAGADRLIGSVLRSQGVVEDAGVSRSRLRLPRKDVKLPDFMYENDFLKLTENHISRAGQDIAVAREWGQDLSGLNKQLADAGVDTDPQRVTDLVDFALGKKGVQEPFGSGAKLSQFFGATAATLKLGLTTAIRQTSQISATAGVFGMKNTAKAVGEYAIAFLNPKNLATRKARVRALGGAKQNQLELYARLTGDENLVSRIADKKLTITGVKGLDHAQRYLSAAAADHYVRDAIATVAKKGLNPKYADYRFLTERVGFTDDDITRIIKEGLSEADQSLVVRTSEEVQGLSSRLDLPPAFTNGAAREMFRFQSFNTLQLQNLSWMTKEAARGNLVPISRAVVASIVAGEGIADTIDLVRDALSGEFSVQDGGVVRTRGESRVSGLSGLFTKEEGEATGDVFSESAVRFLNNIVETGTLGLFEIPVGTFQTLRDGGISPEKRLAPTNQSLGVSAIRALARASKSEKELLQKLKEAGIEFTTDESVEMRALYRARHGGKSSRQVHSEGSGSINIDTGGSTVEDTKINTGGN